GLGGKVETTRALLNIANMNWAYSELFQNYDRRQLEAYLPPSLHTSESDGLLMHFAETHDNQRLAAHSPDYARMRTALAALCATRGAFGFANGVEWWATQKIDVHQRTSLNWGHPHNQVAAISRLNSLLSVHPAFFGGAQMRLIQQGTGNSLALRRQSPDGAAALLILINLDHAHPGQVSWQTGDAPVPSQGWLDLLSEKTVSATVNGDWAQVNLKPAEVLCLSAAAEDLTRLQAAEQAHPHLPDLIRQQCLRERALEAVAFYRGMQDVSDLDLERLAEDLAADPRRFCQQLNPAGGNLVSWQWPRDLRRTVMLPPRHFLLISAPAPFRVQVIAAACVLRQEDALPLAAGGYFVLLPPLTTPAEPQACELQLTVYQAARAAHAVGQLLLLPDGARLTVPTALARAELLDKHQLILGTNGRGGMLRAGVIWGALRSRYDALLAGNLSRDFPEDRRIMLTRCRAWLVYGGYSQDITVDREQAFLRDGQAGLWRFQVPFSHG
ncbi:MAG: glycogen debranching protein, partial [Lentisphaerae bacterium]|nr:glycogen debranching protein [Lentisphaerota bacterium]